MRFGIAGKARSDTSGTSTESTDTATMRHTMNEGPAGTHSNPIPSAVLSKPGWNIPPQIQTQSQIQAPPQILIQALQQSGTPHSLSALLPPPPPLPPPHKTLASVVLQQIQQLSEGTLHRSAGDVLLQHRYLLIYNTWVPLLSQLNFLLCEQQLRALQCPSHPPGKLCYGFAPKPCKVHRTVMLQQYSFMGLTDLMLPSQCSWTSQSLPHYIRSKRAMLEADPAAS